jgi:crotonobetaine/carnitine-CoA ligase
MTSGQRYSGTIPRLLGQAAARDPDGRWLRADGGSLSFSGAAARAGAAAQVLREAGLGRGDLVMVTARTTPPYLLCWLALACLGAICVPVNPRSAAAELAGLVAQVGPRALITDQELAELIEAAGLGGTGRPGPRGGPGRDRATAAGQGAAARTVTGDQRDGDRGRLAAGGPGVPELGVLDIAGIVGDWTAPLARSAASSARLPADGVSPDDVAVLIPTSGTTGRSKLVMQTHRAYAMAGEGFPYWMELTAADVLMTSLPLFHINAPAYSVMGSLACGAGLALLPRFSASTFLDSARRYGATEFNAIGAMLEILMRQPARPDDADTPLRLCYTGPAPERARQEEIEARFGLRIVVGYAMSESPYGLIWAHRTRPFGTLGSARQHPALGTVNEARVVAENGAEAGPGETGELLLRNPVLTPGYWGMPAETAQAIVDGWLHTGDLVTVGADGTYTFVGRRKEVLRRRGENLSPLEVEEVIEAHPAVLECAVVGVPSELSEEEVKAFVVAASGAAVEFAELRAFAAQRLAAFKVPRYWQAIDELPRTPTARIAKHRLPAGHQDGEYDAEA